MAYTLSNMLPLGVTAPDFSLPDVFSGQDVSLQDAKGEKATVMVFWCNHCPYVLHVNAAVVDIAAQYAPLGVRFVLINANDVAAYPEDSPERMKEFAVASGYFFPYLFDESQAVAKAYDAACTPDFYVFDHALCLQYRGQLDASRPRRNAVAVTGNDLRQALDAVLAGEAVLGTQFPSGGCNIKWKTENQPV